MATIASLVIKLQANTAQLEGALKKVQGDLDELRAKAEESGSGFESSMGSSTGAVRLLSHELGVPLPRELSKLIGQIPVVGDAFSTMLPLIGVVAAVAIIGKLIEKHEEVANAARHAAEATELFSQKEDQFVTAAHIANLKLEDQIAKLEGRPENNQLLIAMLEVKDATDKLAGSFAEDFAKIDKVLDDQLGFWENMKRDASEFFDMLDEAARDRKSVV